LICDRHTRREDELNDYLTLHPVGLGIAGRAQEANMELELTVLWGLQALLVVAVGALLVGAFRTH
jgi:hypothetical protein